MEPPVWTNLFLTWNRDYLRPLISTTIIFLASWCIIMPLLVLFLLRVVSDWPWNHFSFEELHTDARDSVCLEFQIATVQDHLFFSRSLRLQMIFAMIQKSAFDKYGIKRPEVASEFLTLISFQYLWCTDRPFWVKNEARGLSFTDDLDILSTTNKANTLSVADLTSMVFSYFLTLKSRIRPVYSNTKKDLIIFLIHLWILPEYET